MPVKTTPRPPAQRGARRDKRANGNGKHDPNAPTFETKSGYKLVLKPILESKIRRFQTDYAERYPQPLPPMVMITMNGKQVPYPAERDETYREKLQDWYNLRLLAMTDFYLLLGVATDPPDEWQPDEYFQDSPSKKRLLWLDEIVPNAEEMGDLVNCISELTTPSEINIAEAEKN